ncbi:L30e-like protein [Gymnopus androsaceus JB14]|uniref:60S ribosomal protein L8 n=1 Tax=Gymnopus androsaceus JB14 TaxID=1447944 RepID=A0A6A4H9Q3_9AGAR|nr:L30e-like protein [Gymnopus androsaceus JB14]
MTRKTKKNPLFEAAPKNFGIGQDIQLQTDLSRFVKWPEYRLKVPPSIAQFSYTLDQNTATLSNSSTSTAPESKVEKKAHLEATAAATAYGKDKDVLALIEAEKVSLVVLAHDIEHIELVVFLPAFCRKMGVSYDIVKGKARLGTVVHKKTAAVVALQDVRSEDQRELATLVSASKANFTEYEEQRRLWGGGLRGNKSTQKLRKRAKASGQNANTANIGKL